MPAKPPLERVRLDKWLWAARFFKTRSRATQACKGGHVWVGGQPARPSRMLRVGELVELRLPGRWPKVLAVTGLAERRGSAAVARTLYEDRSPPPPPRQPPPVLRERGAGRPTKRERRRLEAIWGEEPLGPPAELPSSDEPWDEDWDELWDEDWEEDG